MNRADPRNWGIDQKLAFLALVLGFLALLGSPSPGGAVTINTRELADIVESEVDHVTVEELADWIIQGRSDYRLLDVRDPKSYAAYHIPTAESVELRNLSDYPLYRNEKIVLYSGGGIHSAQAWFLLRAEGFAGSYILLGGLNAWKEDILFPELPADATPDEVASFARRRTVSEFFGGKPRTGTGGTAGAAQPSEVAMPKVAPPSPVVAPHRHAHHHKEGC